LQVTGLVWPQDGYVYGVGDGFEQDDQGRSPEIIALSFQHGNRMLCPHERIESTSCSHFTVPEFSVKFASSLQVTDSVWPHDGNLYGTGDGFEQEGQVRSPRIILLSFQQGNLML
jgi:hypothetical protein